MTEQAIVFDRALIARRRDRAAPLAGAHAFLLEHVADDLVERLQIVRRTFPVALSLGAYNGIVGGRIRSLDRVGTVVECELSPRLLAHCRGPRVLADEEALPFGDGTLDLIVSGLSLQFVNDLPGALVQARRALKPDGLLLAAVLGGETLSELRSVWLEAEAEIEGGVSPRVAPVADGRDLGGLLQRAGFALPVVDSDIVHVSYATPLALMQEIKAMGASNALVERRRTPTRRQTLLRACEIYTDRFSRSDGRVVATFEILTLTAWVPHESQQKPLRPGSAKSRLSDALGTVEERLPRDDGRRPSNDDGTAT